MAPTSWRSKPTSARPLTSRRGPRSRCGSRNGSRAPSLPAASLQAAMRFGLEIHQYLDASTCLEEAVAAERLGYDAVWFGDSQMIWREAYVLLGAAAAQTSRIDLGIGVTNPYTRHIGV